MDETKTDKMFQDTIKEYEKELEKEYDNENSGEINENYEKIASKFIRVAEFFEKTLIPNDEESQYLKNLKKFGLVLFYLASPKIRKLDYVKDKFAVFGAASDIEDSEISLTKGALCFILGRHDEATDWFRISNRSILRILTFLYKEDEEKLIWKTEIINNLLKTDHKDGLLYRSITDKVPEEKKDYYRKVFLQSIFAISRLYVNDPDENLVAHYREKDVAQNLLFSDNHLINKFRLNAIDYSNDPTEGETLLTYLYGKDEKDESDEELNDYEAFVGSFVFDYDNLNMFRLYGKENGKEGTGLSLILKDNFFNKFAEMGTDSQSNDKSSLYRCIYIDPEPKTEPYFITVGQKDEFLFYKDGVKDKDAIKEKYKAYAKRMDIIISDVRKGIKDIKKIIDDNGLERKVVRELLIYLRYLVKHIAFKEEQECRIVKILPLSNRKEIANDGREMYLEYPANDKVPISDYIKEIYFGPKATDFDLFKSMLKYKDLDKKIGCEKSKNPLA